MFPPPVPAARLVTKNVSWLLLNGGLLQAAQTTSRAGNRSRTSGLDTERLFEFRRDYCLTLSRENRLSPLGLMESSETSGQQDGNHHPLAVAFNRQHACFTRRA